MEELKQKLERICEPALEAQGLELVDLELSRKGGRLWVRFFVDRKDQPGAVTLDECASANRLIGDLLDVEDPVPESYTLEVSSPGLNRRIRKLKDFIRYLGETVQVKMNRAVNGRKKAKGTLLAADQQGITLRVGEEEIHISHDNIKQANLEYRFE